MQCEESLIGHIITGWVNNEFKYLGLCQCSETKKPLGRGWNVFTNLKQIQLPSFKNVKSTVTWMDPYGQSEFTSSFLQESWFITVYF